MGVPTLRPHHPTRQQRMAHLPTLRSKRRPPRVGTAGQTASPVATPTLTSLASRHQALVSAASRDHQPPRVKDWTLTTLREKLIKIGGKVALLRSAAPDGMVSYSEHFF